MSGSESETPSSTPPPAREGEDAYAAPLAAPIRSRTTVQLTIWTISGGANASCTPGL